MSTTKSSLRHPQVPGQRPPCVVGTICMAAARAIELIVMMASCERVHGLQGARGRVRCRLARLVHSVTSALPTAAPDGAVRRAYVLPYAYHAACHGTAMRRCAKRQGSSKPCASLHITKLARVGQPADAYARADTLRSIPPAMEFKLFRRIYISQRCRWCWWCQFTAARPALLTECTVP